MSYQCTFCEDPGAGVVQIFTSLETGFTMCSCEDCLPMAYIGGLATILGTDAQLLYDAIKRWADRQAKKAAQAEPGGRVDAAEWLDSQDVTREKPSAEVPQ